MQSVMLKIDENINIIEFIKKIQTIYGHKKIEPILESEQPTKIFGALPDIFSNPIIADEFPMYSREELNER